MSLNEIIVLVAAFISFATNTALYIHLSSTMNGRFDSFERKFEVMLGKLVEIDNRLTRVEERMGIRP